MKSEYLDNSIRNSAFKKLDTDTKTNPKNLINERKSTDSFFFKTEISIDDQNSKQPDYIAPSIDYPQMDPETALIILNGTFEKSGLIELIVKEKRLSWSTKQNDAINIEKEKSYKKNAEKARELAAQKRDQQTAQDVALGFCVAAALFGLIGAIFATVLSGGIATPALIGAIIGFTTMSMNVADRAVQGANGGKGIKFIANDGKEKNIEISFGGMVKRIVEQQEKDGTLIIPKELKGADREAYKEKIILAMTIWVSLIVAATTIACGLLSLGSMVNAAKNVVTAGVSLGEKLIHEATTTFNTVTQLANVVVGLGEATAKLYASICGIQIAKATFQIKISDVERLLLDMLYKINDDEIKFMQRAISEGFDNQREMIENISKNIENYNISKEKLIVANTA